MEAEAASAGKTNAVDAAEAAGAGQTNAVDAAEE
jgi:hypothetical protein